MDSVSLQFVAEIEIRLRVIDNSWTQGSEWRETPFN